jgi:hypothetical protein
VQHPRLADLGECQVPPAQAYPAQLSLHEFCGDFLYRDLRAVVREIDGQLELELRHGRFFLKRRSPTAFDLEDWNARLEFLLDETGRPSGLRFWQPIELKAASRSEAR